MDEIRDQRAHEQATARRTQAENQAELKLCDEVFGHLTDGFNRLSRPYSSPHDWQYAMLLLAALGYNSLRWAVELLLKGYYGQANALSRQAWECWLNGAYLLLNPDKLEAWRKRAPAPKTMRKVVAQRIAESEGNEFADDFRVKMSGIYGNYSGYAHPSDVSTAILVAKTGDEFNLSLGGEYAHALLVQSADMFTHAGELLFTLLYVLRPNDAKYQERGGAIRERLAAWRKQMDRTDERARVGQ